MDTTPRSSYSPVKERDSIDDALKRSIKNDDDFEDSLNVSISEHISEEIESNSVVDDSIEKPPPQFDQLVAEKKRRLFDFGDSDKSDIVDNDGMRKFSKFDVADILDESLSGENIAKHFIVDDSQRNTNRVNEPRQSVSNQTKCDELKIARGAEILSKTSSTSASHSDNMHKSRDNANLVNKSNSQTASHSSQRGDKNDVILINDHEISLNSLLEQQRHRSQSDANSTNQTNQNTTSDISDLQIEDIVREQRSIDDLSGISVNESSAKVDEDAERSKSSSEKMSHSKSEKIDESEDDIKKCKPVDDDSLPELSVIEEVSDAAELSSHRNAIESTSDKRNEIRKIINETVDKLPLDKENRPPNLHDDLLSVGSKQLNSSQNSTLTDGTVYNVFAKMETNPAVAKFQDELNLNLMHLQNKIKELQNIHAGKYSVGYFDLPLLSSSRRDSLKDFQSGRDSTSLTTNSTEYRPFQDEYSRVSKTLGKADKERSNAFEWKQYKSIGFVYCFDSKQ